MKPYTKDTICPKCNVPWWPREGRAKYCDGTECKGFSAYSAGKALFEHLHCHCENCGYEWLMECADAERAELSPEEDGPPDEAITYTPQELRCPYCLLPIELAISSDGPKALVTGSFAHRV